MRNIKPNIFSKNKKQSTLTSLNKEINSLSNLNISNIYKTLQNKENIEYNNNNTAFSFFNNQIQTKNKKITTKNKLHQKYTINKKQKIISTKSFNEYQFNKINKTINTNVYNNRQIRKIHINNLISKSNNLPKNIINNFSQTTYNIYNINTTPVYNLTNYPLFGHKKFFSQNFCNDTSYVTNKNISKKILNFSDYENENEKNNTISSYRPFSYEKNRINNNNTKMRNKNKYKKHLTKITNINNIYKNKNSKSFFKSTFDNSNLSLKLKQEKNTNSIKSKFILNKNKNRNNLLKQKLTGLKKYLKLSSPTNKSNKTYLKTKLKEKSLSFLTKLNNSSIHSKIKNKEKEKIITKKVMKINSCTLAGYKSNGMQKINQDKFFIKKDFLNEAEQFFIGVCDGHGMHGHFISEYISKFLPKNIISINNDESIKSAFISTQKSLLIENRKIDSTLSGSTCCSVIISQNKIICSNLGNSRAILSRYENGIYTSINLSRDHKLTEHDEMKRILNKGGIIKQSYNIESKEFFGPQKIFLKNSEIPGLSITRSFGDNIAHNIGVISEPEIFRYNYNGNEKFIVIGTEGIWKYIDSEECVNIMKEFYEKNMDAVGGLNMLVKESFKRWKNEEGFVEDITAIVLFFE